MDKVHCAAIRPGNERDRLTGEQMHWSISKEGGWDTQFRNQGNVVWKRSKESGEEKAHASVYPWSPHRQTDCRRLTGWLQGWWLSVWVWGWQDWVGLRPCHPCSVSLQLQPYQLTAIKPLSPLCLISGGLLTEIDMFVRWNKGFQSCFRFIMYFDCELVSNLLSAQAT